MALYRKWFVVRGGCSSPSPPRPDRGAQAPRPSLGARPPRQAQLVVVWGRRRVGTLYAITDPYLAFWFRVLYSDLALIQGGQGRAVLQRARPRWASHLGQVFEDVARAHAQRLVAASELPADLVVGRWWAVTGEPCEVDVLGLRGSRTALLGEAKWQAH